jgi:uncharacterized protein
VRYGLYDVEWLLQALTPARLPNIDSDDGWVLAIEGRKGLPPIEGFFLARHFMYQQVYQHKATRAAECLIKGVFMRVAELIRDGSPPEPTPPALRAAVLGEPIALTDYLKLDDSVLIACLAGWERSRDATLADLATRFRLRALPKTLPLPPGPEHAAVRAEAYERVCEITRRHGLRPEITVWLDVATDVPYSEPTGGNADGLWIALRHRPIQRLGDVSFILGQLRNKCIESARLVFPAEVRHDVLEAVEGVIR